MFRQSFVIWSLGVSLWLLGSVMAQAMVLVESQESRSTIYLTNPESPVLRKAAEELQYAISRVTGAKLETQSLSDGSGAPEGIVISSADYLNESQRNMLGFQGNHEEELIVRRIENTLFLVGNNDRTTLHAVYHFLEEVIGVRWMWPGETGEFYPQYATLRLAEVHLHHIPVLQYRFLAINAPHYDLDTLVWMARQRMNVNTIQPGFPGWFLDAAQEYGFLIRIGGHHVTLPNALLEKNPEYLAEYGGVRVLHHRDHAHLCWANEGVQRELVAKISQWLSDNPEIDILSLYPADHNQFCSCSLCRQMAPDISTRWQKLSAILIDQIKKNHPDIRFWTLAYQAYRNVPTEVAPYDSIGYTVYNGSYRYPYNSGAQANETFIREIKAWSDLGVRMGIRGYEMIAVANPGAFLPLVYFFVDEMRYVVEQGLNQYSTEVAPYGFPKHVPDYEQGWNVNRLNLYAVAKATYNPDLTVEEIVGEWCRVVYGPAAEVMQHYYFLMEEAWKQAPGDISYFLNPSASVVDGFIDDDLVEQVYEQFTLAEQAIVASGDDAIAQRYLREVTLDRTMFGVWQELHELRKASNAHYVQYAMKVETEDALHLPWEQAREFPLFIKNDKVQVKDQTRVKALWDDQWLYLRIVCEESGDVTRMARFTERDSSVWSDDCIEIFLNDSDKGAYWHLAVNSLGTLYDAYSPGGMNLDVSKNLDWKAHAQDQGKGWEVIVALPLSEISSGSESEVRLSIKRSRSSNQKLGYPNSGWPDAAYHNVSASGKIQLVDKLPVAGVIYSSGRDADNFKVTLRRHGWLVDFYSQFPEKTGLGMEGKDWLLLRYGNGRDFEIPDPYMKTHVKDYLEGGGLVIVSTIADIDFSEWFGRMAGRVFWDGGKQVVRRITAPMEEGNWYRVPHDLSQIFARTTSPYSTFRKLEGAWSPLATIEVINGEKNSYLAYCKIGDGMLVVTTSGFGFSGGGEIFGNTKIQNIKELIDNLLEYHRSTQV